MSIAFDFLGAKEYLSCWHSGRPVSIRLSSDILIENTQLIVSCKKESIGRKAEDATQWGSLHKKPQKA